MGGLRISTPIYFAQDNLRQEAKSKDRYEYDTTITSSSVQRIVQEGWSHWVRYLERHTTWSTFLPHQSAAPGYPKAHGMSRSHPARAK
jgi:hypothetical protein